jgi:hypothetical protein
MVAVAPTQTIVGFDTAVTVGNGLVSTIWLILLVQPSELVPETWYRDGAVGLTTALVPESVEGIHV